MKTIITYFNTQDLDAARTHKFLFSVHRGYTYLDIAAERVFKAKEFDETTESKIIYNLLKSKEFTHSNKYLKDILAKIDTINIRSDEFNFAKTILDGTVIISNTDNNSSKSYAIDYQNELKKIDDDKLLALGLSQDNIKSLKQSQTPSAATSGEASVEEAGEQQPSLLDLVKNGTIHDIDPDIDISPFITDEINKNEPIGGNGETYLDFAADNIKLTKCNLTGSFGHSSTCLANIKIYNYLKENGFDHSENYKGGELKEFMKFMIQTLQILNYNTPENSIQLKKLFNGVVLNYNENNSQMDLDQAQPYVTGTDLDEYKAELANLAKIKFTFRTNNKLTLLGFPDEMITDLKQSVAAAPEEEAITAPEAAVPETQSAAATPSLLDLVKSGKIDDIEQFIDNPSNNPTKNELIEDNGKSGTYLDFAGDRVRKNCDLGIFKRSTKTCLENVEIYAYLKENGFVHSDEYNLEEFMKFMIKTLQKSDIVTDINSRDFKLLFVNVVLNYHTNVNGEMTLMNPPYVDGYKEELGKIKRKNLKALGFTKDMIEDLKNSAPAAATTPAASTTPAAVVAATTPAETQPAAIVATTPEAASAQQKPIRKSNNQQVAVVQEIKKQRKEAGLEDEEGKPSEIQEIYEAVENMDDEGKNNGELLNEVVETKIESLITKIANFYAQDNHYSVVGNEKVLSVYLETKYKFTYDGTKKTKIYDYVLSKSESADPPLNKTQKDQLSLVMVTLLRNMGWKKSQAKLGTYVNDYGLRPPGNWDSLSKQLIELPMGNDKRNWKLQSTEKYVPMIANMRDSNFDQQLEQLNTLIRSKLSGIKDSKKQGLKISYLNRVKAEIEKIPQGSLSQDNINTLKMTIMVWKVLSMTPVQGNLPDENLVKSVGEGNDSDFSTNLNSIMKVLDDDEKEDYVTGKSRSGDGNLYLLGFIDSDADEPETPTQSLLDLIKSSTDMVESIRAQFKDDSQFQDDITRELVSTGSSVQPGDGSSDGSSDGSVPQRGFMGFNIGDYFPTGLFGLTGQTPKSEEGDERSSVGSDYDDDEEKNSVGSTASVGGGRKLRKTKKKKANKKKNRKTRSKKSKNQRKKK